MLKRILLLFQVFPCTFHLLKKIRFDKHIDFICYSTEEFNRTKTMSSVLIDALEHCENVKT